MLASVGFCVEEIRGINWQRIPFYFRVLNRLLLGGLMIFLIPNLQLLLCLQKIG